MAEKKKGSELHPDDEVDSEFIGVIESIQIDDYYVMGLGELSIKLWGHEFKPILAVMSMKNNKIVKSFEPLTVYSLVDNFIATTRIMRDGKYVYEEPVEFYDDKMNFVKRLPYIGDEETKQEHCLVCSKSDPVDIKPRELDFMGLRITRDRFDIFCRWGNKVLILNCEYNDEILEMTLDSIRKRDHKDAVMNGLKALALHARKRFPDFFWERKK
jgi:hypothetical protein